MKYEKKQVIKRLQARAKQVVADAQTRQTKREADYERDVAESQPHLRALADQFEEVAGHLRSGDPDQFGQVRQLLRDADRALPRPMRPDGDDVPRAEREAENIKGLVELLKSSPDEHVSSAELDRLGVLTALR